MHQPTWCSKSLGLKTKGELMKIIVVGGSGLIGSKLVKSFGEQGHEVMAASPKSGVNTLTREGLSEVLKNAQVVVDVSNSPSFEDEAVMEFFKTSTVNLLSCEATAGVRHHVAVSIVGIDRLPECGYFRAKDRSGETHQGKFYPLLDCPSDAVLRVRQGHRRWSN